MFRSFTCCVGSGMESHALHGDGIYYESDDQLWVNLYAPSTADWEAAGVKLADGDGLPRRRIGHGRRLTLTSPKEFTLRCGGRRGPAMVFASRSMAKPIDDLPKPGSYVEIKRTWNSGDKVALDAAETAAPGAVAR